MSVSTRRVSALLLGAALLGAGLVASGCAAAEVEGTDTQMPAEPPTAVVYELSGADEDYRLVRVVARVPERFEGQTAFTSDAMRGVAALLDHVPAPADHVNLWNGDCAPGEEVTEVHLSADQVVVHLEEWNGTVCDIDQQALAARDQQLAWTIIANSTDLPGPPFPQVVVHDGSGVTWDISPDDSFLPAGAGH